MTNAIEKRQNGNAYNDSFGTAVNNLFQNRLRHFFNENFWETVGRLTSKTVPVNIRETEGHYELDIIAPGCQKEDFNIKMENNLLTISMDKGSEKSQEDKKTGWVRNEFVQSSFSRTFSLDDTVDLKNITATYSNGILHLQLGKNEKARQVSKNIAIK